MRKNTSMSFAFGALVIATAPVKADSQQANMILMQIGSVERQAPTAQMSNEAPHPHVTTSSNTPGLSTSSTNSI